MKIRGYDEFRKKLQIYCYDTNLRTYGNVVGDEGGSVWCAEEFGFYSKGSEAGKRHQLHILKNLLWQLCGGWGGEAPQRT